MIYEDPNIPGWMLACELQYLYTVAKGMDSIIEVGSWMGKSTHALLSGCRGTVYAIDHFKGTPSSLDGPHAAAKTTDIYQEFMKNVGMFNNLIVLNMASQDAAKVFADQSVDMVWLDADHAYEGISVDIDIWLPKARKLICGHDYNNDVKKAVLERFKPSVIQEEGTIWSVKLEGLCTDQFLIGPGGS